MATAASAYRAWPLYITLSLDFALLCTGKCTCGELAFGGIREAGILGCHCLGREKASIEGSLVSRKPAVDQTEARRYIPSQHQFQCID